MHYFGRKIGSAKDALALLQGKGKAMQNLFKRYHKKLGVTQEQAQEMWFAYVPKDFDLWRFIDQLNGSSPPESGRADDEHKEEEEDGGGGGEMPLWSPTWTDSR